MALFALVRLSFAEAPPSRGGAQTQLPLKLLWADPGRVLVHGLLERGHETMERELTRIFETALVDVSWEPLDDDTELPAVPFVVVILAPFDGSRWGLSAETLGAVIEHDGRIACVYVFEPAVSRALGVSRRRTPGHYYELARALGRVAAHEIVHALVPELAHGRRGLMRAKLTRSDLVGESLGMRPATSSAISARLAEP